MIDYKQEPMDESDSFDDMEFHEVATIFPMMEKEEYEALVMDIRTHGLQIPIWTYEGKIIDGRNRYKACLKAGIKPHFQEWDGNGSLVNFVVSLNLNRRHLSSSQKAIVALEIERLLSQELSHNKGRHSKIEIFNEEKAKEANFPTILLENSPLLNESAHKAARSLGTSATYIRDAKKIIDHAPELKEIVLSGTLTIPEAKQVANLAEDQRELVLERIKSKKSRNAKTAIASVRREASTTEIPHDLPIQLERYKVELCSIVDFHEHIQHETVDVIITDPPYPRNFLSVYDDLAQFAIHALKPGGSLVAMVGQSYLPEVLGKLQVDPLKYHWLSCYYTPGDTTKIWQRHIGASWKPLLWFVKGEYGGPWVKDVVRSGDVFEGKKKDKKHHEWGQPVDDMVNILNHFSQPGQLICDPFIGGGSTAVASVMTGRQFVGCDIDPQCVQTAINRIQEAFRAKEIEE